MRGRQYHMKELESGEIVKSEEFTSFEILEYFTHARLNLVRVRLDDGRERTYFAANVEVEK